MVLWQRYFLLFVAYLAIERKAFQCTLASCQASAMDTSIISESASHDGRMLNHCNSFPGYSTGKAQTAESTPPQAKLPTEPLKTVVSLHAQYLRDTYQTQIPTFLTLQWPPPPTRKVFNLAMIQGKNIPYGPIDEEMVRLTLRGQVKDILYEKKPIELKDIFQMDNAKRKVILIEGAPGSGKSTLAWHVCQTWESGKLFQTYRTVMYIQLRDPAIQSANSVEDIIPALNRDQAKKVMAEFKHCRGQDLLFILDTGNKNSIRSH